MLETVRPEFRLLNITFSSRISSSFFSADPGIKVSGLGGQVMVCDSAESDGKSEWRPSVLSHEKSIKKYYFQQHFIFDEEMIHRYLLGKYYEKLKKSTYWALYGVIN